MKVDGSKFRAARLALKENPPVTYVKEWEALRVSKDQRISKVGTQQWLSEKAGVTLKVIQLLEQGSSSWQTIYEVNRILGIDGAHYVYGFGESHIKCGANRYVDFRPATKPEKSGAYLRSSLMLTIDPLIIEFLEEDLTHVTLREVILNIDCIDKQFSWWSYVEISPNSEWLGQVEEVYERKINDHEKKFWPIMFKQTSSPSMNWKQFVEFIDNSEIDIFKIDVKLDFVYFEKSFSIEIEKENISKLFSESRSKYTSPYPFRLQCKHPLVMI